MMTATETISDSVIVPNSNNNDAFIIPIIKSALKNATIMNKNITAIPPPSLETLDISSPDEEVGDGSYLSKFYKLKQEKLANLRPLSEFFDRNRINMTSSFQVIAQRWNYNLQYFSSNYFIIMLGLVLYSILTNWFLLFTICFIFAGFYFISNQEEPIQIVGIQCSTSKLYAAYSFSSFFLLLLSGATGTLLWIIGASALIILGHAAILEPGIEGDFAANQV